MSSPLFREPERRDILGILKRAIIRKIEEATLKKRRAPVAEFVYYTEPQIRRPQWDYVRIYDEVLQSWVMRMIIRAISQEVFVPGFDLEPKFATKCATCGTEYESPVEECYRCKEAGQEAELRPPNPDQKKKAESLLKTPNPDYSFVELMKAALKWHLTLDDVYLSIAYKRAPSETGEDILEASELYVEDSRFIFPVADDYGHLGNNEWFCPVCYVPKEDNKYVITPEDAARGVEPICPKCKGKLFRTCYVLSFGEDVKHRFDKEEIVHGSEDRLLPSLFGNPKIISVWKQLLTINSMDDYNQEIYTEGKVGGFLMFPGHDQSEISTIRGKIQKEIEETSKREITMGRRVKSKKVHTVMIGLKEEPKFIPTLPDPKTMQSLDFYKLYRDSMCSVYGVTPVFVSIIESGRAGNNPRMQIDVQNNTTKENQQFLENLMEKVFSIFNIYDWALKFEAIEMVDELRESQILQVKSETARTLLHSGFNVSFDEDLNLKISGEGKLGVPYAPSPEPKRPEVSEPTGAILPGKTVKAMFPRGAMKLRDRVEADLRGVLNWARAHKKEGGVRSEAHARANKIIKNAVLELSELTKSSVSSWLGRDVGDLPREAINSIVKYGKERYEDFKKILADELKRE